MKLGIVPENVVERLALVSGLLPPGIFEGRLRRAIVRKPSIED
jgi:hypothetical protein